MFCIKAMNNPGGGAERVLADVAGGLARQGAEIALLTYDPPGGRSFYPLAPEIRRIELGLGSSTARATIGSTLLRMRALRQRVRDENPDVAIAFMHSMFIPLGLALVGTGVPIIASEHIVPEHYRTRPLERLLLGLSPRLVDRITCVSEQARDAYPPALRRKMVAIPNPVTVTASGRADMSPRGTRRRVLLTVGRLEAQKDHATLVAAFARIADRLPDWILRIVGDGDLRPNLEAQIKELGLVDRVELPGFSRDVGREYLAAQLFVLPSRYESFGLSTAEALVHGLPAIGFDDCPGTNELIRPGINGVLVASGGDRVAALAEAMTAVMADEALRRRLSECDDDIPATYRLDAVLARWRSLIAEVAGRPFA